MTKAWKVAPEVLAMMRAHAERAWPEECVGALLGHVHTLEVARPLQNVAPNRTAGFLTSASGYLAAEAEAEEKGLALRGFYHSHPDGPARRQRRTPVRRRGSVSSSFRCWPALPVLRAASAWTTGAVGS